MKRGAVVISLVLWVAGCNDTAIVLRISSDRPTSMATPATSLDGICVELDAGGAKKFGQHYALSSLPLPQTLTVLPAGRADAQMIVYGLSRGLEVARARQELSFRSGSVLHVDVPLDACQPHGTSARFAAAAPPSGDAYDAVAMVPGANQAPSSSAGGDQIGRASCRERV